MELKEAYIDKIICHHFSIDPTKSLVNNALMNILELDSNVLKEFFIKPFANVKAEYSFSHPVDLSYNIIYQTALKMLNNENFVKCSQDVFRHLKAVSTLPSIKDGDLFVAKISDVVMGDSYYDGLGIFKIEQKSEFIETFLDENGNTRKYDGVCKRQNGSGYQTWEEVITDAEKYAFFRGSIKFLFLK